MARKPKRETTARITEVESLGDDTDNSDLELKSQASIKSSLTTKTAATQRNSLLGRITRMTTEEKSEVVESLLEEGF